MTDAGPWWDTGRILENGHPAYYQTTELDVLLILEVWIEGELVTFRASSPTFLWIEQFKDAGDRERYLTYWIRQQVGRLTEDPGRLARLRQKLMVVEPKDQHTFPRCKRSAETALTLVRCDSGEIRRHDALLKMWQFDAGILPPEPERLGACPCRCHDLQRQARGGAPRMMAADQYFREGSLAEEEALRDI